MRYRTSNTNLVVQIVHLRLNEQQMKHCYQLRSEAGRCWTDMLHEHIASRSGAWLSEGELKTRFKGKYQLHSQTVQALCEKLIANVDTARELRKSDSNARYPYHDKQYMTVVWKEQAIRRDGCSIILSNGRGNEPLTLTLPTRYCDSDICKVELCFRADHYELCLTIDTDESNPPLDRKVKAAGIDLGEINIAACVTNEGIGVNLTGRYLRSIKQLRNKRHAALTARIAKCADGSKHKAKLRGSKAKASAKFYRQSRDILHKAAKLLVNFATEQQVAHLAVGDVRDIQDGVACGHKSNQKISQWAHGQFVNYVTYKARRYGISVDYIAEDYSTRTCSVCKLVKNHAPKGRVYTCSGCGAILPRDGNGGANICSRYLVGEYGHVQVASIKYLRPVAVVPRKKAMLPVLQPDAPAFRRRVLHNHTGAMYTRPYWSRSRPAQEA
jgi:putative transposase